MPVRRLRSTGSNGTASTIPADQRASDASLRARLNAALQCNQTLAEENARLRRQLARALGHHRLDVDAEHPIPRLGASPPRGLTRDRRGRHQVTVAVVNVTTIGLVT
jgi:hypothetical protein